MFRSYKLVGLVFSALVVLSACKSADERAEEHYQRGMELVAAEDYDRASIEFRSVFRLNGSHQEARHQLAQLMKDHQKNPQAAYSQYLRLVEQYPDDLRARIELSEMAFLSRNWEEVERHGAQAESLAPDNVRVQAVTIARNYRQATIDENASARAAEAARARDMLATNEDNAVLRNILIDSFLRDQQFSSAIDQLDWLIEREPTNPLYWRQRLSVLVQLGDTSGIEEQLRQMVAQFPEDISHKLSLVRFFISREELDKAEDFLRELSDAAPSDDAGPRLDLIRFLSEMRGPEAAQEEIEKAISEVDDATPFRVMGAGLDFATGRQELAVATLEDVLKSREPSEQTRGIKVSLARMLLTLGNEVGARARVEEVLAEDPNNANALKMQAAWMIEADETDEAIGALRIAMEQAPEDPQAMTLMANAYTRSGRSELARDFLALAVDASNNAPEETMRYARVLMTDESYLPAEDLLKKSLRLNQNNVDLLVMMGELYVVMEDLGRADQIARSLREIGTVRAINAANGIEAEKISQTSGPEEAMAFLESMADDADSTLATRLSLVRARLGTGNEEGALELALELLEEAPDNIALQAVVATTQAVNGNLDEAEAIYRQLLAQSPTQSNIWLALAQVKARQSDPEASRAVVEEGLAANPGSPNLLWARASYLEQQGDFDQAISVYEELYEQDSNSIVIANNLASMLSTYRTDEESLERAYVIARRFRDADIPAIQDTYGWIAHRRGDTEEALSYLEAAAEGLPGDAIVQYHLGQAYLALGRNDEALAQFRKTVEASTPSDARPQVADAIAQIEALENPQN